MTDAATIASRFINNTNRNIFLTGKAGTGKTTFLRSIVEQTHKNTIVAAPTGIAAINAGGVTLHSLFQLPFGTFIPANNLPVSGNIQIQLNTPDSLLRGLQMHSFKRNLLQEMELLIIDEVSMLRADLLDAIDVVLRSVRRSKAEPFGGVQVLFIGDLFQLPPVVKQEEWEYLKPWYDDIWFFAARALRDQKPLYIELDKIYRQSDNKFITLLNHFREDKVTREDLELLNEKYNPDLQADDIAGYIHLTTHNRKADAINREALKELPGRMYTYDAVIEGDFNEYLYPVDSRLELKEGAQVMFIKNDYSGEQRYFNGKIGTVSSLSDQEIEVSFDDGEPDALVERYTWENKKFSLNTETNEIEERVIGTFSHYPLKLAWAITVHKSQGLTFEKAIIDVSSAFAPGQIYVALSRLVSLDGLILSARIPYSGPGQDEAIREYVQHKDDEPLLETVLQEEIRFFIRDAVLKSFNFGFLNSRLHYFTESHDKDEKRSKKQQYKTWSLKLETDLKPLRETAEKFTDQLKKILRTGGDDYLSRLDARMEAARGYFEPLLNGFSERIFGQIRLMDSEKGTKAYQKELKDLERIFFKQRQMIYKAQELIRTAIEGTEFSKERWNSTSVNRDRIGQVRNGVKEAKESKGAKGGKRDGKGKEGKGGPREERERSDKISFDMFRAGKGMDEIAQTRSLTLGTIQGHLVHYVENGQISIFELVDRGKVEKVLELIKDMEINGLNSIREQAGNDISYGELRLIIAHRNASLPGNP